MPNLPSRESIIDELGPNGVTVESGSVTLDDNIVVSNAGGSAVHSNTTYDVRDFIPEKVSGISVGIVTDTNGETAYGTGLCRKVASDKYELIVNGKSFLYNSQGEGISSNALGTKIKLGETTPTQQKTIVALNARDEFAMHILGELLKGVPDPSLLGTTEMAYYTKLAYTWSAYMMDAAADGREADSSDSGVATTYDSNTEALLGQIAEAIEGIGSAGQGQGQSQETNGTTKIVASNGTTVLGVSGSPFVIQGTLEYPSKSTMNSLTTPNSFLTYDDNAGLNYTTLANARAALLTNNSIEWDKLASNVKGDFQDLLDALYTDYGIPIKYSDGPVNGSFGIVSRPREYHGQSEGNFYLFGTVTLDGKSVINPVFRLYYGHIYMWCHSDSNKYLRYDFNSNSCVASTAEYNSGDTDLDTTLNNLIDCLSNNYGKTPAYTIDINLGKVQTTNGSVSIKGFIRED